MAEKVEGIKAFWITLIFALLAVAIIIICTLIGVWNVGVVIFVVCLISALMLVNKDKHGFEFGIYYLKASIYLMIGGISSAKIIISYIEKGSKINENIEFLLIALVSFMESIHNFVEWKRTLDRIGK